MASTKQILEMADVVLSGQRTANEAARDHLLLTGCGKNDKSALNKQVDSLRNQIKRRCNNMQHFRDIELITKPLLPPKLPAPEPPSATTGDRAEESPNLTYYRLHCCGAGNVKDMEPAEISHLFQGCNYVKKKSVETNLYKLGSGASNKLN
jgi:hypothetical protein